MLRYTYLFALIAITFTACGSNNAPAPDSIPDQTPLFNLPSSLLFSYDQLDPMAGACTKNDKRRHIWKGNKKFLEAWDDCGSGSLGSADGTADCLKEEFPTLSKGCAQCFGNVVGCARVNCFWSCTFGSDAACEACSKKECFPDLYRCGGIRERDVP